MANETEKKNMNYLHIMPPSKRMMLGYITVLREAFPAENHRILFDNVLGKADWALLLYHRNTVDFPDLGKNKLSKYRALKREFDKADRVVFHCFKPSLPWLLFLYMNRHYLDKAVWVIWGIDLYNYKRPGKGLKARILNHMETECRRRMRYPVVVSEIDRAIYEREFGSYPVLCAPYGFLDERFTEMDELIEEKKQRDEELARKLLEKAEKAAAAENGGSEENAEESAAAEAEKTESKERAEESAAAKASAADKADSDAEAADGEAETEEEEEEPKIRIQVGHNAFPFNNHVETLDLLQRFRDGTNDKRIAVVLPIAYGNGDISGRADYRTALIQYANDVFRGVELEFWTKMVDNYAYTKRLATIDIAIFNSERQNGLGNLLQLLYMGKKVYLSPKNPLFPLIRQKGFELHDINELRTASFEEFIKPVETPFPNPWVRESYSVRGNEKIWKIIFAYVEGRIDYETAFAENKKLL